MVPQCAHQSLSWYMLVFPLEVNVPYVLPPRPTLTCLWVSRMFGHLEILLRVPLNQLATNSRL